jgi:hypothetical protein
MKAPLLFLLVLSGLAHATPPVLSLTQAALQKIDPDIKPDHYDIARTDLNADGRGRVVYEDHSRRAPCSMQRAGSPGRL